MGKPTYQETLTQEQYEALQAWIARDKIRRRSKPHDPPNQEVEARPPKQEAQPPKQSGGLDGFTLFCLILLAVMVALYFLPAGGQP